jgi:hypothetical protein
MERHSKRRNFKGNEIFSTRFRPRVTEWFDRYLVAELRIDLTLIS